jgi:DNA sulfur modification protein DndD
MIIKSIRLSNFQCYHGSDNLFEFSEGLNVIIGDNGAGKSKLYDAFYWVVYDKLPTYNKETPQIKGKFVNARAKQECFSDEIVKTEVELIFVQRNIEYQLQRTYSIARKGDTWVENPTSTLKVYRKNVLDFKPVSLEEDKNQIIGLVMNKIFEDYMWFQGEQVERILDFEQSNSLKKAVEILSGITQFDEIKIITAAALKNADTSLREQLKRSTTARKGSEELSQKIDNHRNTIDYEEKQLIKKQNEIIIAQKRLDELELLAKDSDKLNSLQESIRTVGKNLEQAHAKVTDRTYNLNKNLFNQFWLLRNAKSLHQIFENQFESYRKKKQEERDRERDKEVAAKAVATAHILKLPKDVPDEKYLKLMLSENVCYVCNRDFTDDAEARAHIEQHLNHPEKAIPSQTAVANKRSNFQDEFRSLDLLGQKLCKTPMQVTEEIRQHLADLRDWEEHEDDFKAKLTQLEKERDDILDSLPPSSQGKVGTASREIKQIYRDLSDLHQNIGRIKSKLDIERKGLETAEEDVKELAKKNLSSPEYEWTKRILDDLNKVAESTRSRVFKNLIVRLEKEANKHYTEITAENKGFRGMIEFVSRGGDDYVPKIVSDNGDIDSLALNQSNLTLVKLSVIMAIITGRGTNTAELYPLITDAPTSNFTENYTIGFCKQVSKVYKQSIVMDKNFYINENLKTRLLTEIENLGNVYVIESALTDAQRDDLTSVSTFIKKIK